MKRIVLFSAPEEVDLPRLFSAIFPPEIKDKVCAYMPYDGANISQKYTDIWQKFATDNDSKFNVINNSLRGQEAEMEKQKMLSANILVLSGGNTFAFLNHLKLSGLDQTIKEFAQKQEFVIAGFSAGALVLTPTIEICNLPNFDENIIGLKDLTALGLVDFEVFPHYDEKREAQVKEYEERKQIIVKRIGNEKMIIINQ